MAFPSKQKPYVVRVGAVTVDGIPVTGATLTLHNRTKATSIGLISNETNSHIAIPLSRCGDWDMGDVLYVNAAHGGNDQDSDDHTTVTGDHGVFSISTIAITTGTDFAPRVMFF